MRAIRMTPTVPMFADCRALILSSVGRQVTDVAPNVALKKALNATRSSTGNLSKVASFLFIVNFMLTIEWPLNTFGHRSANNRDGPASTESIALVSQDSALAIPGCATGSAEMVLA